MLCGTRVLRGSVVAALPLASASPVFFLTQHLMSAIGENRANNNDGWDGHDACARYSAALCARYSEALESKEHRASFRHAQWVARSWAHFFHAISDSESDHWTVRITDGSTGLCPNCGIQAGAA